MEKKNKYILNMGLAFDEDRVLKKLRQMAKEGWILEKMSLIRYNKHYSNNYWGRYS
ncbi:hypothetical protein KPL37_09435 [Clostridium frigoris]|uniref:DUF4177 domain-containing protein n=1 Tax=Clostridium frigoris TaxID=205327 RepID=A0ABS6BVV0_9CLOT|nr:hypothetical protein [Clostridium frigoris]MBU3159973.1 hypothetical protein [Clostridium frigoris]